MTYENQFSTKQMLEEIQYYRVRPDDRSWRVVGKEKSHKSAMWTSGLVLESKDTKEYKWYCLASQNARTTMFVFTSEKKNQAQIL